MQTIIFHLPFKQDLTNLISVEDDLKNAENLRQTVVDGFANGSIVIIEAIRQSSRLYRCTSSIYWWRVCQQFRFIIVSYAKFDA